MFRNLRAHFHFAQAALADTKVPAVEVLYAEDGGGEPELELDDDPAACLRLDTAAVPVILTLSKVNAAQGRKLPVHADPDWVRA